MTTSEKLFLVLAEELNFSRAAKKSFISQQALSEHIKRLEQYYGLALFIRFPSVKLTEAGKNVQKTLQAIQSLEQNLKMELGKFQNGTFGTIRFGINYTRAKLLIPTLFEHYHIKYPNIKIELVLEETVNMQEMMKQGKIDSFLGINGIYDEPLKATLLSYENIYLIASKKYLIEKLGWELKNIEDHFTEVELQNFNGLPFAMNHSKSTTYQLLNQYMEKNKINLKNLMVVSDYQILENVCRTGYLASFCTQVYLPIISQNNALYPPDFYLYALPLKDLQKSIHSELVYNQMLSYPEYVLDFFNILKESVKEWLV
ncbi:LysR family transcriptional regulator [Fusobacterium simiae]|uniref:LysR family transcriptional regulator n=1 Tax=Fusobacterium TaxID=848 RepID=UPI00189A0182|nr:MULTISPECIES: LysR family transcriptional regulator [Fusobacterium]MDC7955821.1 LysR family transcriptional regulator [Fusobacterium simiae]